MARRSRRGGATPGVAELLVLDADGVSKAARNDPVAQAWLERAGELDADVVVSAVTLAEIVRGVPRDAGHNRVVKAADVWPADESIARQAGRLLGRGSSDATIDGLVAATALAARTTTGAVRCVVLTSDPDDLTMLLAEEPAVRIVAV